MRLQDKVIAITGSGSGLGRECALLFAEEGARIVTSDVVAGRAQTVAKEVEAAGGQAVGIDADVRSEPDMERLVHTAVDSFGRIDVMFANAGIPEPGFGAGRSGGSHARRLEQHPRHQPHRDLPGVQARGRGR